MGNSTHRARARLILTTLLVLAAALPAGAQVTWQTLTSFKDVRRMAVIDDTLYVATSGGLLVVSSPDAPGQKYIHTDGLGTTDLRDIMVDGSGNRWLAGYGRLIKFDELASRQYLFRDRDGNYIQLYSLVDQGDNLWIGTGIGLVLFSKTIDGGQIEDSYLFFGDLNPSPNVLDLTLANDTLWLATSAGLAAAPTDDPDSLKSPSRWTVFDVGRYPELGSDTIRCVTHFQGDVYVGTPAGAFRLERTPSDTSFVPLSGVPDTVIYDLQPEGDTLFVYHSLGLTAVTAGGGAALATNGLPSGPVTGIVYDNTRWLAAPDSGLYRWEADHYVMYPYTGAPGNNVSTLVVDDDGVITAGFGTRTYSQYIGEDWVNRNVNSIDGTMDLMIGPSGSIWASSWGNGLFEFLPDTSLNFDERNSTCTGILGAPSYVVVRGTATDGVNLFAVLYYAANGTVVATAPFDEIDQQSAWTAFGIPNGLSTNLTSSIACARGQLAVGTTGNGVFLVDLGSDPWTGGQPQVYHYTADQRLRSDEVRTVAYPPEGGVWVGTNLGVSRWDWGTDRFVDVDLPISADISSITFDGRSNAWIGTRSGLFRRDATSGAVETYTTENSGLVSNHITDVFLDRPHGNVYIATDAGISILRTQLNNYTTATDSIVPIPNPFVIRSGDEQLVFNYDGPARVNLYTVAGEQVAEFSVNAPWDGRNQNGRAVTSGAYLYVITHGADVLGRGKILLIRK